MEEKSYNFIRFIIILVLFSEWEQVRIWGHLKFPLDMYLNYLRSQYTQSTECFLSFFILNSLHSTLSLGNCGG